jgi:hypothetical protein
MALAGSSFLNMKPKSMATKTLELGIWSYQAVIDGIIGMNCPY